MKVNKTPFYAMAFLTAMSFITPTAYAEDQHQHDLKALLELKALGNQSLTLKEAILMALKEQPGLLEKACLEYDDGRAVYQVEIANGKDVYRFHIEPASGKMTENRMDISDTVVNYLSLGLLSLEKKEQMQITSNLQTGLTSVQGKVLSIDKDYEDNMVFFEVQSLHNNQLYSNVISGRTGELVFYQNLRHDNDRRHN